MYSLYFHIPFCRQACTYCNFHFSTSTRLQGDMIHAMVRELELRQDYLPGREIGSVYFGGGTPSLLSAEELGSLLESARQHFRITADAEITLEANPDDISRDSLAAWKELGINRFSLGVQSFDEEDLRWMHRAHHAGQSRESLSLIREAGFENITLDLIYGLPGRSLEHWKRQVEEALEFQVPHISAYCLTVEPKTRLAFDVETGKVLPPEDEAAAAQYLALMNRLEEAGFVHYEISNFGKPGFFSRHNTHYWKQLPYLGIGPSAHSFDGDSRQWNIANNALYVRALAEGRVPAERESLSARERYHERVMTGLRTLWGVRLEDLEAEFREHFSREVLPFLEEGLVLEDEGVYRLSRKGKLYADGIASALFLD